MDYLHIIQCRFLQIGELIDVKKSETIKSGKIPRPRSIVPAGRWHWNGVSVSLFPLNLRRPSSPLKNLIITWHNVDRCKSTAMLFASTAAKGRCHGAGGRRKWHRRIIYHYLSRFVIYPFKVVGSLTFTDRFLKIFIIKFHHTYISNLCFTWKNHLYRIWIFYE